MNKNLPLLNRVDLHAEFQALGQEVIHRVGNERRDKYDLRIQPVELGNSQSAAGSAAGRQFAVDADAAGRFNQLIFKPSAVDLKQRFAHGIIDPWPPGCQSRCGFNGRQTIFEMMGQGFGPIDDARLFTEMADRFDIRPGMLNALV